MRKEKVAKEKEEKEAVRVLEQIEAVSISKHMKSIDCSFWFFTYSENGGVVRYVSSFATELSCSF